MMLLSKSSLAMKVSAPRSSRAVVCKAGESKPTMPEWVPEQAAPVLSFLESDNFKLAEVPLYTKFVAPYAENKYFQQSTGFKPMSETINGRAAMLGFVAAAGAEIFGQGPFLAQLSKCGLSATVIMAAITAASLIPVIKGTEGGYLNSLKDTYSLPEGVFTERMEKVHGRLAMVGLASLIILELVFGRAIL